MVRSRYSENYIATISCTWEWASKHFLNLYFTWIDYLNNVHTKGSVFFNQSFTNFKNLFLDLISLFFFMYYFVLGGERHKMWKKYIFTLRGVQNFTGADPTDRHRWHRPNCSVDRMSWGQHSDFALRSDVGAVKSSDWEIRNRDCAKPNWYRICSSIFF